MMASSPIPQPPPYFLAGNLPEIDINNGSASLARLAQIYGPIYQLQMLGRRIVVLSSQKYVNEVCDEKRFEKKIGGALEEVRAIAKDGLFTAYPEEKNWHLAHKLLMPVFGPLGIRKMFPQMIDICSQLVLRWDRFGPNHSIDVSDDFTRLAFDTIGLCGFSYRFNDFYSERMHPFADWMADTLRESGRRANRTKIENAARIWSAANHTNDIDQMHKLCDDLVRERKANPQPDANDLLNVMLMSRDPETGEGLSDENIRYQMVTFLIAGHETTSGTLSFLFYSLLKNPETLHAAQKQVDEVLGDETLNLSHIPKLTYIDACIKETLRQNSPIGGIALRAKGDTQLDGKYDITATDTIVLSLKTLHRDPEVWGKDADAFRPERMLNGGFESKPPNSWLPFGHGMRGCIGRAFAWQEMMLTIALILQRFTVEMADPSYDLKIKATLTIKPEDFRMKVRRRHGKSDWVGLFGGIQEKANTEEKKDSIKLFPLRIFYGSNSGTCKAFADELKSNGAANGFEVTVGTLDSASEHMPKGVPVVIISPSYEGQPADNAKVFVSWLEAHQEDAGSLDGVKYTVFGAGNSDWANTFHRIPKLVDTLMGKMGAQSVHPNGFGDAKGDLFGAWDKWAKSLWESLRSAAGNSGNAKIESLNVHLAPPKSSKILGGDNIILGTVRKTYEIAGPEAGFAKRHMEIELPKDVTYQSGDYLVVLPLHAPSTVSRVIHRFDLSPDDMMLVSGSSKNFLPTSEAQSVFDFFATFVELNTPATQAQLSILATATTDTEQKAQLEIYAHDDAYMPEVFQKRRSVIDLLEQFPSCHLPFPAYVDMLKPLQPRQYSISSSPLALPTNVVTISFDVYDAPALSGAKARFKGVASTYLAYQPVGGKVRCMVRPTNIAFHLPSDTTVPIIMIAAGTGLAPMRGFLQERAALAASGSNVPGPAILYFGCRDPELDFIYKDELMAWQAQGIVQVRTTFSRAPVERGAESNMHKYVSERIWDEREELTELFRNGAKIFVCGSAVKVGKSVKDTCIKIYQEAQGVGEDEAREWLRKASENRFVTDLYS